MRPRSIPKLLGFIALGAFFMASGCGDPNSSDASSSSSADTSASGAAASSVGGALSGSSSGGTLARLDWLLRTPPPSSHSAFAQLSLFPSASAAGSCPTFRTTGSGCATSGGTMWLTYSDCNFGGAAEWNGVQEISMSAGSASCGTFPNPGDSQTLYRQIVQASNSTTPGTATIMDGTYDTTLDDASSNLDNFDGDTIGTILNSGYGVAVGFNGSGARSSIEIGHHISVSGVFNHSITGTVSISETAGASSRTISGSLTVYHNLLKVVGASTFNNVVHENGCCMPVSGSISTVFSAGTNVSPTAVGELMVGKTEKLTFTGCGTATFQAYNGSSANVTLDRCF